MKKIFYFILFVLLIFCKSVKSQTDIPQAQALFIYNFTRMVEWPATAKSGDFVIGVLGSNDVYNSILSFAQGKKVGTQSIIAKSFKDVTSIEDCHILFVAFSKTKSLPEILKILESKNVLIITEKSGAIQMGAGINFVIVGDKLKFEVKIDNITKYGLKVSSKLAEMAVKAY